MQPRRVDGDEAVDKTAEESVEVGHGSGGRLGTTTGAVKQPSEVRCVTG